MFAAFCNRCVPLSSRCFRRLTYSRVDTGYRESKVDSTRRIVVVFQEEHICRRKDGQGALSTSPKTFDARLQSIF